MLAFFLSHWEIVVILLVALLLFGTRLPKVARSLGQGVSEFKDGLKGVKDEVDKVGEESESESEQKQNS